MLKHELQRIEKQLKIKLRRYENMLLLVLKHTNLSQHHLCNTQCITDKHLQEGISNISINLSKKFSNHFLFVCVNVFVFFFTIYDSQTTNYRKTVRVFVYITIRP